MNLKARISLLFATAGSAAWAMAAQVPVPGASFESPVVPETVPALPLFEAWQHTPKPDWYVEDPEAPETQWANLAGVFPNPAAGQPGRIDNADGAQAGYIFGVPSNGIFQELNATYGIAETYSLTVALAPSSTIPPADGSTLALSLYYRDSNNQIVPLATTNVPYNSTNFSSLTNFVDFSISMDRPSRSTDARAGKNVGVMLVSTAAADKAGGIWDLDNVRVTVSSVVNGSFESPVVPSTVPALPFFTGWQHTPKPEFYVEDPSAPETAWANLAGVFPNPAPGTPGNITNVEGGQAGFLFAVPSNGIFQEGPAAYEPGVFYHLSAGLVASSTIPPAAGSTLSLTLYYRDAETNLVPVASREIVYNTNNFPSTSNLVYFTISAAPLTNNHPAIGQPIGVAITSAVAPAGGIWDVDDVRVAGELLRLNISRSGDNLRFTWASSTAVNYQLQTSPDLVNWADRGTPLPGTGNEFAADIPIVQATKAAFFRVRVAPR